MKNLNQKIAVVTGAGSGLGRALAICLNQSGAHLALCDLNQAGLVETKALLSQQALNCSLHTVDVSNYDAMKNFADEVIETHKQVDILINNAGITLSPKPFTSISHEQFEKVININMWGVYHGIRHFLPHLSQQEEASIINISSLAGLLGIYGYSPYSMSKFAVRSLSEVLQMELHGTGTSVLAVYPGGIKTNIIKNAPDLSDEKREESHQSFTSTAFMTPEKAAKKIVRAMQKKRKRLILGADAKIVNMIRNLFPSRYTTLLAPFFSQAPFMED